MKKLFNKIYVEITNVCNLNCSFCPKTSRKPDFMSFDLFKEVLLQAKPLCDQITLHIMGEPLFHPQIGEFISYANSLDIKINLTTNGTLIKEYILLNKSISRINFSLHGLKSNFSEDEQQTHLLNIIQFTKLAQLKREDLIIVYRLWNINDVSNKKIINTIEQEFDISLSEDKKTKISTKIVNNAFIHYDNSFKWPNPTDPLRTTNGFCHGLSSHIGILSNGTVIPCCLDNNGNIPLGNIKDELLTNILNSKKAKDMKKGFQDRKLINDLCQRCTFIKRFEKDRDKK